MPWNWQQPDWPDFRYDADALEALEKEFLLRSGELLGAFRHVEKEDQESLRVELYSDEAMKTSEIEGEILNRDSVQSSLRQQLGLDTDAARVPLPERGIAEMMVDLYRSFDAPLNHEGMFSWHRMVMAGERRVEVIADYRRHEDPMQIISGPAGHQRVHFEAPPSRQVHEEMSRYIAWFNDSKPEATAPLPALTRAGIAHLHFESIHPFEDGNGRIGRALSEKAMAQNIGQPSLIALAYTIERNRKDYYRMLEQSSTSNEITEWLAWFGQIILEAQATTLKRIEFYIAKARFYDQHADQLNERQAKVIARMFREGVGGFQGGLSAENYISITRASRATATRDLQDLVANGALRRTGERRYTRYYLNIEVDPKESSHE